jgi:hypothetical protein
MNSKRKWRRNRHPQTASRIEITSNHCMSRRQEAFSIVDLRFARRSGMVEGRKSRIECRKFGQHPVTAASMVEIALCFSRAALV